MCSPLFFRLGRSAGALPVGLLACALALAGPGLGRADGPEPPPQGALAFVRGGLVLAEPVLEQGSILINGGPPPAGAVEPLPGGGWLVQRTWTPRETLSITWRAAGRTSTLLARAPLRPTPLVWRRIPWQPSGWLGPSDTGAVTALAFSGDGRLLAVGGEGGRAAVFRTRDGRRMWELRRPGRVIKHVAFGPGGRVLFVGEQGPEGRLAAYQPAQGGGALWTVDTAAQLGSATAAEAAGVYGWVRQPGAYRLVPAGGDLIAAFSRSWLGPQGPTGLARVFRVNGLNGSRQWAFPPEGPAQRIITWLGAARQGGTVALPLQLPGGAHPPADGSGASQLVVLKGADGQPVFRRTVAPVAPQPVAEFWRGVALHPDGRRLAAATQDGRGFWFAQREGEWRQEQEIRLVAPVEIGGGLVGATNGSLAVTEREVLFVTGPSYAPLPLQNPAAVAGLTHPRANTVFAFDWVGKPLWVWPLQNDLQGIAISQNGGTLALGQGGEAAQQPGRFNGVAVLALAAQAGGGEGRLLYRFPLAGRVPYGAVAVSTEGRWIAVAEAPRLVRGDARRPGAHQVWLLR